MYYPDLKEYIGFLFFMLVVYENKGLLFKASGLVWHQKNRLREHLPKDLRGVDKTATWSKGGIADGCMDMDSISPAAATDCQ